MSDKSHFITVDEAREAILGSISPVGTQRRTLRDAHGTRLAEHVAGPFDLPAFDNAAMDGFAFAFKEGATLRIVGESAAGAPFDGVVGGGEAVRIMTGAAVPAGCDTVAMREVCNVEGHALHIDWSVVSAGQHVRTRGSYIQAGGEALRAGSYLGSAEIGLLASFGRTVVATHRAPIVAIVTTGSELVEPDRELGPGQIFNSNSYMLEALCRESGARSIVAPIVEDDEAATRAAIRDAATTADLVLTIGGVSVGDYDFVQKILNEESGGMMFWKVRMKPGKPLAFGTLRPRDTPIIGLPGNPVSSFVGFHQFVRPALAALQAAPRDQCRPRRVRLRAASDITSTLRRREYVLGHLDAASSEFVPHANPSSGNVLLMHGCDALAVMEEGVSAAERGDWLDVEIL